MDKKKAGPKARFPVHMQVPQHPSFNHSMALTISSTTFFASPKTIIVLSM